MKAMVLKRLCNLLENQTPLELMECPVPVPAEHEILIKVSMCGVCHTELDEIEGRTPPPNLPIVPGHQVIGRVEAIGNKVSTFSIDDRVGVAWIFSACGNCKFCLSGHENLCNAFEATGRDTNGGYAQYMTICLCDSSILFRRESGSFAMCRCNRLSLIKIDRFKGWTTSWSDRVRCFSTPGFKNGQTPLSQYRGLCFYQKYNGEDVCLGTGSNLGRGYQRNGSRKTGLYH